MLAARARPASLRLRAAVTSMIVGLAAALAPAAAHATPLPPQGLYEECAPSTPAQCASELAQMSGAGFRLAVNYEAWAGTAAQVQTYAAEATADGIQLIWPLNDSAWLDPADASTLLSAYPLLAQSCGCTTNLGFERYAVGLVEADPATWGWYVGDELTPAQAPSAQALAGSVRALDPAHPLLYVASANTADPLANLRPFASVANVLGADVYPIGQDVPASYVGAIASDVAAVARGAHSEPAMVLQAFSWSQYPADLTPADPRWPTEPELRTMRDAALTASPAMILWYSFKDLEQSGDFPGHWHDLVTAAFGTVPDAAATDRDARATGRPCRYRRRRPAALSHRRPRGRRHATRAQRRLALGRLSSLCRVLAEPPRRDPVAF